MKGIKEKKRILSDKTWDQIEDLNRLYDAEAQRRFLLKITKEDKVSMDEAARLCSEDPKYSLGWKMCSPAVMMSLARPKGREKFRKFLTPEEDRIFMEQVVPMGLGGLMKKEMRKKKHKDAETILKEEEEENDHMG